jgi:integrase
VSEGSVFKRGSDGNWCAKYKDAHGKYRYIYRKTKTEAKQALRAALKDRDEGKTPAVRRNGLTVGEAVRLYLDRMDVSTRTLQDRKYLVQNHLGPIADKKVSTVTPDTVRAFYRKSPLAPSSIKLLHTILRNSLPKQCMEDVKPPRARSKEIDSLSKQELLRLLDTVKGNPYEGVFVLMGLCALRIGEALSLRWEDIDFAKGTVRIRRTLWQGRVSEPKTPRSRRTIQLPRMALDVLGNLHRKDGGAKGSYIFATSTGNPINYSNFYTRQWKPAVYAAGLPSSITPHKLRHGAASLLLNEGVPIPIVSKYLGHANPGVTMRIYAHALDGTSHLAAAAMDEALR